MVWGKRHWRAVGRVPGQSRADFFSSEPASSLQATITLAGTGLCELPHPSPAGGAQHRAGTAVTRAAPRVAGFCGVGSKEKGAAVCHWVCASLAVLATLLAAAGSGSVQLQARKSIEFAVPGEEVTNAFASPVNAPATAR